MILGAFADAIETHSRYHVGSTDQAGYHAVATAMYGSQLMVLAPDVDACDYFLLIGAQSGGQHVGVDGDPYPAAGGVRWSGNGKVPSWSSIRFARRRPSTQTDT